MNTTPLSLSLPYLEDPFPQLFPKRSIRDSDFRVKYKTELCRNWELGICEFGESCAFAHGNEELRNKSNMGMKYKTKKCKQFHEQGFCIYGNRCQFKHRDTADCTPNTSPKNAVVCENSKKRLRIFVELQSKGEI